MKTINLTVTHQVDLQCHLAKDGAIEITSNLPPRKAIALFMQTFSPWMLGETPDHPPYRLVRVRKSRFPKPPPHSLANTVLQAIIPNAYC